MFNLIRKIWLLVGLCVLTAGCGSSGDHAELRAYIQEVKSRPPGMIEPIPTFRPYEAFIYSAAALRSPFKPPIDEKERIVAQANADLEPDFSREKEYLESFELSALSMVGTLARDGKLWALIRDNQGGIHRVTTGNHLGKNFGRIVETTPTQIEIIEIVSNGLGGWVERPRVLKLSEEK